MKKSFPMEWKKNNVKNTSYLKGRIGWQGLRADEFIGEGPYLVTGTDFINGKINWDVCYHVSYDRFKISPEIHLTNDDLLITKDGTIGKVALVTGCPAQAVLNSGVFLLRPIKDIYIPRYFYWILCSEIFKQFLKDTQAGSTINHLYQNVFERFAFSLPRIPEQSKIAEILSTIDEAIDKTDNLIEKYKRIKQGLMQDLFRYGIDEHGQIRSEKTHKFKDSPLGMIPEEWGVVKINEVVEYVGSGVTPTGGQNVYLDEGVKFIRSQNVHFQQMLLDDIAYIDIKTHRKMKRTEIHHNDILLNITGASIGRCCVVPLGFGEANVNQHVCIIRLKESHEMPSQYVSYFISMPIGQNQIDMLNAGSNRQGLNYRQVRAIIMPWPNREEQHQIASYLKMIDEAIEKIDLNRLKLEHMKSGLMDDLLSGKVRVVDLMNRN